VVSPLKSIAQQLPVPVIGFLSGQSPVEYASNLAAFRRGLNETGYVEHRNVGIEYRWAQGQYDRLPAFAAELVSLNVDVIAATGTPASALAAKAATASIPIVFITGLDPVKLGLVTSFNRPGGNATGVSFLTNEIGSKRLQLLHELVPTATAVGFLVNPRGPNSRSETTDVQTAARVLGLQVYLENASTERDIEAAFASFVQLRVNALFVASDAFFGARRDQLAELAARHALPASYTREARPIRRNSQWPRRESVARRICIGNCFVARLGSTCCTFPIAAAGRPLPISWARKSKSISEQVLP
jgi:putative ABC transport system substrate-binding protein